MEASSRQSETHCSLCKGALGYQSDTKHSGDACDLCAAVHHSECLLEALGPRGNYSLCHECLAQNASFSMATPEEVAEHGEDERNCFETKEAMNAGNGWEGDAPAEDAFKALDVTLDFIVKFLEGAHAKSTTISKDDRSAILQRVQSSLEWKKQWRSKHEVQTMVEDLNVMMTSIVRRI